MHGREALRHFAREELERTGSRSAAAVRFGPLNHASRILGFLTRTLAEYEDASAAFFDNIERQEEAGNVPGPLFDEGARLSVVVHLRIETFHALARLLLDRVAQSFEGYLGPAPPGLSVARHAELERNLVALAERKGLEAVPATLLTKARRLGEEFLADRDFHVRLPPSPEETIATVWSASGAAGMTPGHAFPREMESDVVELDELMVMLDDYVADVIDYIDGNRAA